MRQNKKKTSNPQPPRPNKNLSSNTASLYRLSTFDFRLKHLKYVLWFLFGFFLATQLGKHFFLPFSYIAGVRVDYLAPTLYLTDILAFLIIMLHLRDYQYTLKRPLVAFVLLLLAIQTAWSVGLEISLYRFIKFIEFIAIFGIVARNTYAYPALLLGLATSAFFQATLAILQLYTGSSMQGAWYLLGERYLTLSMPGVAKISLMGRELLRSYGTFSHPNSMAGFYLLLYSYALVTKNINKFLKNCIVIFSTLLIILSFSKVAISTWAVFTMIYFYMNSTRDKQRLRLYIIGLLMILPVGMAYVATSDHLTLVNRMILAKQSLQIMSSNPFTGVGIGAYLYESARFAQNTPFFLNQPVHNVFLLMLAELGLPLSIFIFYVAYKYIFRFVPHIVLGTLLFTSLFDHYWWTLQQNILLLAVIGGALFGEARRLKSA